MIASLGSPRLSLGDAIFDLSALRAKLSPTPDVGPAPLATSIARADTAPPPTLSAGQLPTLATAPVSLTPTLALPVLHMAKPVAAPPDSGMNAPAAATGVSSPATVAPLAPAQFRPVRQLSRGYVDVSPTRQRSARKAAAAAPAAAPVTDVKKAEDAARRGVPRGAMIAGALALALLVFGSR